jgi:AraC-like DNA-binding protein
MTSAMRAAISCGMSKSAPSNSLASGIAALAAREGCNGTLHPGIDVYRLTASEAPTPTLYRASIILVGAGEKRGILGREMFVYNARNYLVVTSPLPMLCQTIAAERSPLLSVVVGVEIDLLRELVLELNDRPEREVAGRCVFTAPLEPALEEVGVRLLGHLADERRTRALARQTVREMLFHVLDGPYGDSLRAVAQGPMGRLSHVLRHMNACYRERLPVEELARLAHMSVPTFHQHFKAVTATSPLQYLKAIRLTRARQLLQSGDAVKSVAHLVGYESESQFSREYRRFFGAAPSVFRSSAT